MESMTRQFCYKTYKLHQHCVTNIRDTTDWKFPNDAQHHFEEIRNRTERLVITVDSGATSFS